MPVMCVRNLCEAMWTIVLWFSVTESNEFRAHNERISTAFQVPAVL